MRPDFPTGRRYVCGDKMSTRLGDLGGLSISKISPTYRHTRHGDQGQNQGLFKSREFCRILCYSSPILVTAIRLSHECLSAVENKSAFSGIVFGIGLVGFRLVGPEGTTLIQAAYMSVVTITSVGFREVVPLDTNVAMLFGMVYMLVGMGVLLYVVTTTTAFVIEGYAKRLYMQRRTRRMVKKMKNHCIICGIGRQGTVVVDEFLRSNRPFVMVEGRPDRVDELHETYPRSALWSREMQPMTRFCVRPELRRPPTWFVV